MCIHKKVGENNSNQQNILQTSSQNAEFISITHQQRVRIFASAQFPQSLKILFQGEIICIIIEL